MGYSVVIRQFHNFLKPKTYLEIGVNAGATLNKYRKDLKIVALDAGPTGLVCITNLNPTSNLLSENYFNIVQEFTDLNLSKHGDEYIKELDVKCTKTVATADAIGSLFWL